MNDTAAQPAAGKPIDLNSAYVGKLREVDPMNDPRLVRWGYNPGQRQIWIPGRTVGGRDRFVPVGEFIPMTTFQTPQENCTLDEYKEKEILVDVTAQDVENRYRATLGQTDMGNWGFQSLFYGVMDVVKVIAINELVLPTLQEIRGMFENPPIPAECPGEDEMDLVVARSMCAKCHLQWIDSQAFDVLMADALENGREKSYYDEAGELQTRLVTFKQSELDEARKAVRGGLTQYQIEASRQWQKTLSELESGKRLEIQDAEHYLRKDLHQIKPQNKELETVERLAKATSGSTNEVLTEIARGQHELRVELAESRKITNVLLAKLIGDAETVSAPAEKDPAKAADTKKKENTEQ